MDNAGSTTNAKPWPTNPDGSVNVAHCPEHGLHGDRETCFECGMYVEPIPMVPVWEVETLRTAIEEAIEARDEVAMRSLLFAARWPGHSSECRRYHDGRWTCVKGCEGRTT